MRRIALVAFGLVLIVLDGYWLVLIGPHLSEAWPGALIAMAFTIIGVLVAYEGTRSVRDRTAETASGTMRRRPLDRWILAGGVAVLGAFAAYIAFVPWGGSPGTKVRLILLAFEDYQVHLDRLCTGQPLTPSSLEHADIRKNLLVHKRMPRFQVQTSVVVQEPDSLVLTVTLPEIAAEGVYAFSSSGPIAAGTILRARGRCERGTMFWTRLESTVPEEHLQAARRTGI